MTDLWEKNKPLTNYFVRPLLIGTLNFNQNFWEDTKTFVRRIIYSILESAANYFFLTFLPTDKGQLVKNCWDYFKLFVIKQAVTTDTNQQYSVIGQTLILHTHNKKVLFTSLPLKPLVYYWKWASFHNRKGYQIHLTNHSIFF